MSIFLEQDLLLGVSCCSLADFALSLKVNFTMVVHASIYVCEQRSDKLQRWQDRLLRGLRELLPNAVRFIAV